MLKSSRKPYCGGIRKFVWPDGRIRPRYKLDGTLHGRFKSNSPAVHNIPADSDFYNVYTAPPGWVILHIDFHQADMRVMCCFSEDEVLRDWLKGDPHTELVMEIYKMSEEDVAKMREERPVRFRALRIAAKMVNFGLPYGRSAKEPSTTDEDDVARGKEIHYRLLETAYWFEGMD